MYLDSAAVIETPDTVLLNSNDAKLMGSPLTYIKKKHPKIDFALRSHSSANARICYELIDQPGTIQDETENYIKEFSDFMLSVNPSYAIPFASNACHLHKDTVKFNKYIRNPKMVEKHFKKNNISSPSIKVMVSGDEWNNGTFNLTSNSDYFENPNTHIKKYLAEKQPILDKFYIRESKVKPSIKKATRFFSHIFTIMPFWMRWLFKGNPITFVLNSGDKKFFIMLDIYKKKIEEIETYSDSTHPIQIHTSTFIFNQCITLNLFTSLPISKRVTYRVHSKKKRILSYFEMIFDLYEYGMLPLKNLLKWFFIQNWLKRWREIFLYSRVFIDLFILRKSFKYKRYL